MARQSDVGSPPPPIDINTPDGSVLGDSDDAESQYEYPWLEKIRQEAVKYKEWTKNEWERVELFLYRGPTGEPWPKKPRADFKKLDEGGKNKAEVLSGQRLHDYLVENCATADDVEWPDIPAEGFNSLENMRAHLKAGWEMLKQHNKKTLGFHINYGKMLNVAFAQHQLENDNGETDSTWEEWLGENVGISAAQGRKIREIARLLAPYPGFMNLGLSFSEVYKLRKQIETMLSIETQTWSNYWRRAAGLGV